MRERLVLAGMPGDVEMRLVEERRHRAAVVGDDPHLPGVLLDELDRAKRVGLRRREELLETAPHRVGATERDSSRG